MRITAVWLLLMLATALSWGSGLAESGGPAAWRTRIGTGLLCLALFKARLILMHFMEAGRAPPFLRWIAEAWAAGLCAALVLLYRLAPA